MVGEIADFVAKHKAKTASFSTKKTETKRPGSVGELGKSLEKNDPETLRFIKRHETQIHGEKPEVATKYALDNPINSNMKPEEGVYEEEEMEEATKCPKCGAQNCTCQHEECGKKLKTGKLKEQTLCNFIAMEILEDMKAERLDEQEIASRKQAKEVINKSYDASRPTKRSFVDKVLGRPDAPDAQVKSYHRNAGMQAKKKFYDLKSEGVDCSVHKVSPGDPDYTGGMHIHTKPRAEVATGHKPAVAATEKSKKLSKKEVKEGHKDPMPSLDNPSHGSGCTGHEDPMIHVKKPQSDPTKIPNMNKPGNSTQPPSGVLDKKKSRVSEEIASEGVLSWLDRQAVAHQGQWRRPAPKPKKAHKAPAGYVKAKEERPGGFSVSGNQGKWLEGGKKKVANEEVIDEISKHKAMTYVDKSAADFGDRRHAMGRGDISSENIRKTDKRYQGILRASGKLAGGYNAKVPANEEVENIQETLPASASASDYIHDFVHSKNKMFSHDSKKKRIKRALGAYYHKKHKE